MSLKTESRLYFALFFIFIYMNKKICNKCNVEKDKDKFYHWKKICIECHLEKNKQYRQKNKKNIIITSKNWYKKTKEERKKHKNEYYKNRIKNDCLFALKESIKRNIRMSFVRKKISKNNKTYEILGCTFEDFKKHIESQFQSWMNWENKGKYNGEFNFGWDLDHIIPISSANTEEDIKKLNYYKNFQHLCSKINRDIKKNGTVAEWR